tara:strand:- start:81 stop:767 length:687 start_codon:yes stop_codon:yes gene_type:complete
LKVNKLSHVAFILDGNKRWAEKNNLNTLNGYQHGFDNVKNIVKLSLELNIQYLTIFALSSENFNRTSINLIYKIIYSNFGKLLDEFINQQNVKINILGSRSNIPKKINEIFNKAEELSKKNNRLHLNIAFNYGFSEEIKFLFKKMKSDNLNINLDNDLEIKKLFFLGNCPDPEILIRTGGYQRLSNFIMYNLTYTELFFTETLWPDFDKNEYLDILNNFYNIDRKYGL